MAQNKSLFKQDFVTRAFLREHGDEITDPAAMDTSQLATTLTYCQNTLSFDNPYTLEIVSRAGYKEQFLTARAYKNRRKVLDKACETFGIRLF